MTELLAILAIALCCGLPLLLLLLFERRRGSGPKDWR